MAARGSAEVPVLRTRLKAAFERAKALKSADPEVLSDYAKYLCVLVSGFVETALTGLAFEHCRSRSAPTVLNFVASQAERIQNVKSEKLCQLFSSFDKTWGEELADYIDGSRKDALNSVIGLRNAIAHGGPVSLTLSRILDYYKEIVQILIFIKNKLK